MGGENGLMRDRGHLLRILGVGFGLAAVVGMMVGQGILRSPGVVAEAVHHPWLMMALWIAGGLLAALSALAYVELGAAIPCAGGPTDYVHRAFGSRAGVLAGWTVFLGNVTSTAMIAYVAGEYLVRLGVSPTDNPAWPALAVVALFFAINWIGTQVSSVSQMLFSTAKGVALLLFVIVLFAQPGAPPQTVAAPAGAIGLLAVAIAMRVIIGTYNGWQDMALFCEELENPGRSLVRSMLGGIAGVTALYLLVNLALLHVLTPARMAGSTLAAADAASLVFGPRGEFVLTLFGVLSVAAITNLGIMSSTRIAFALGRAGMLPQRLAEVAVGGTPRWALGTIALLIAGFIATGTFDRLSSASTSLYQFAVILVTLAAIGLRVREPDLPRPFKVRWFAPVAALSLVINGALLAAFIYESPADALLGFALLAFAAAVTVIVGWLRPPDDAVVPA